MREGGATRMTRKPGDRLARNPLLIGLLRREGVVMKRVLALSLFFVVPSFAQSTPQPVTVNDQIVVTASSLPETVQATPAAVTVITRKDIDERAARDVADVLREVPGLSVSRTGSLGKTTSVFIRGASSKQALVLWNGVEINDPYFS